LFSFASFQAYNYFLTKRIYKNSEENVQKVLYFLQDEIINVHDGRLIRPLLKNMQKDERVIRAFLLDSLGLLSGVSEGFSPEDTASFKQFMDSKEDVNITTNLGADEYYTRAFLHIHNNPSCYECHSEKSKTLGYIILDFSLKDIQSNLVFTRNFSIIFTSSMVLIILIFVLAMHFRIVNKSLSSFQQTIKKVNDGDLSQRVAISETSELGKLGGSFNHMLDTFQTAQVEILQYHKNELQSAEKLASIGEMAARLAHDVRNPLTGIANSIEIISGEMKDSPNEPILQEIQRQVERVNFAVTNLLKYSHTKELKFNEENINQILNNLVFFLKNQKQNRFIEFELKTETDIPKIIFDGKQIEDVLMNLLLNAIQAMKNKGKIIISNTYDKVSNSVIVAIDDSGPGIPEVNGSKIFKPFFTSRTEGTGLGLAISKDIIEKHNGKIWFENKPGKGTVFYISLPVDKI